MTKKQKPKTAKKLQHKPYARFSTIQDVHQFVVRHLESIGFTQDELLGSGSAKETSFSFIHTKRFIYMSLIEKEIFLLRMETTKKGKADKILTFHFYPHGTADLHVRIVKNGDYPPPITFQTWDKGIARLHREMIQELVRLESTLASILCQAKCTAWHFDSTLSR